MAYKKHMTGFLDRLKLVSHSLDGINKAIIIDPVCYPGGGHNIDSCLRFACELRAKGITDIHYLVAGNIKDMERLGGNVTILPELYPQLYRGQFKYRLSNLAFDITLGLGRFFFGYALHLLAFKKAKNKLKKALSEIGCNDGVLLFFPSCDFYFALAALEVIQSKLFKGIHIILKLRFIGVMENGSLTIKNRRSDLLENIFIYNKDNIILTSETARYSEYLSAVTGKDVSIEPYPFNSIAISSDIFYSSHLGLGKDSYSSFSPLTIMVLGKPRPDKGSLILEKIANCSLKRFGLDVVFYANAFEKNSKYYVPKYKIKNFSNIKYQDSRLSYEDLKNLIISADIVLMPYDNLVYWNRGSAMFFEAIEYSKLIIGRSGCAFTEEMKNIGAMKGFSTIEGLMDMIEVYLEEGKGYLKNHSIQGYSNYKKWYFSL